MSDVLSRADHLRCVAVQAASRIPPPPDGRGMSTSGLLSRAAQIETWLSTGVSVSVPVVGQQVGVEGLSVLAAGRRLTPELAQRLHDAVERVVA